MNNKQRVISNEQKVTQDEQKVHLPSISNSNESRKRKNYQKKTLKETIRAKKKSSCEKQFKKQRRGSRKTVLYKQPRATISTGNLTRYGSI